MIDARNGPPAAPEEQAYLDARAGAIMAEGRAQMPLSTEEQAELVATAPSPFTPEQEARIAQIVAKMIHESTFKQLSQVTASDADAALEMADSMKRFINHRQLDEPCPKTPSEAQ